MILKVLFSIYVLKEIALSVRREKNSWKMHAFTISSRKLFRGMKELGSNIVHTEVGELW